MASDASSRFYTGSVTSFLSRKYFWKYCPGLATLPRMNSSIAKNKLAALEGICDPV